MTNNITIELTDKELGELYFTLSHTEHSDNTKYLMPIYNKIMKQRAELLKTIGDQIYDDKENFYALDPRQVLMPLTKKEVEMVEKERKLRSQK